MPTQRFQCEIMIFKEGQSTPIQCDKIFEEFQTLRDQQDALMNHFEIHRVNGTFVTNLTESKISPSVKGAKMKISHCPKWIKGQTFESFENMVFARNSNLFLFEIF